MAISEVDGYPVAHIDDLAAGATAPAVRLSVRHDDGAEHVRTATIRYPAKGAARATG